MHGFLPILVSAIAMFIIGGLWYSPMLFAHAWVKAMGLDPNDKARMDAMKKGAGAAYLQTFLLGVATSYIFWRLFHSLRVPTAPHGALVAVAICLATVVASKYTQKLFGQGNMNLFLIDSGYQLVSFAVMGAILGVWR